MPFVKENEMKLFRFCIVCSMVIGLFTSCNREDVNKLLQNLDNSSEANTKEDKSVPKSYEPSKYTFKCINENCP